MAQNHILSSSPYNIEYLYLKRYHRFSMFITCRKQCASNSYEWRIFGATDTFFLSYFAMSIYCSAMLYITKIYVNPVNFRWKKVFMFWKAYRKKSSKAMLVHDRSLLIFEKPFISKLFFVMVNELVVCLTFYYYWPYHGCYIWFHWLWQ